MSAKIAVIIQARMSSQRLPGKVLRAINGKLLLDYLLESASKCEAIEQTIVATSEHHEDDAIESFSVERNIPCFRGELDNVANRLLRAAKEGGFNYFVRVNGDSPLLDYRLINHACELLKKGAPDMVTNVHPRTFPKGQSVELIRTAALSRVLQETADPSDLEHVTPYFYRNTSRFRIENFKCKEPLNHLNYCVDTMPDFERISRIVEAMQLNHYDYTYKELSGLQCAGQTPESLQ